MGDNRPPSLDLGGLCLRLVAHTAVFRDLDRRPSAAVMVTVIVCGPGQGEGMDAAKLPAPVAVMAPLLVGCVAPVDAGV